MIALTTLFLKDSIGPEEVNMYYKNLIMIANLAKNSAIGKDGKLLCRLKRDMEHFIKTTVGDFEKTGVKNLLVTGRKNYESIPEKFRPFKDRDTFVLTRMRGLYFPGCQSLYSVSEALDLAEKNPHKKVIVIGGGEIYRIFMPFASQLILTHIEAELEGDTFFPPIKGEWDVHDLFRQNADADNKFPFCVKEYNRK